MDNNDNKELIDELFRLFKKMMDKYPDESISGLSGSQVEQIKFLLSNYDSVKDQISFEMLDIPNDKTSHDMLVTLVNHLRGLVGEGPYEEPMSAEEVISAKEDETITMPAKDRREAMLKAIDEELTKDNLSQDEIDALLDKRLLISSQQQNE